MLIGPANASIAPVRLLRKCRQPRLIAGALDPTASEGSIQVDQTGEPLQTCCDQCELRVVQVGLCSEHTEIAVDAIPVAEVREIQPALLRFGVALLCRELIVVRAPRSKTVGNLA